MKKIIGIVVVLLLLGIFTFLNSETISARGRDVLYASSCETPKHYRLGVIDQEFNVEPDEFARAIEEAAGVWEKAYGKKLFVNDPEADLTISLKYDERQSLNTEINELNTDVKQKDTHLLILKT